MSDKIRDGIREVMQSLYDEHGEIKSSMLVEAARPKTSPAHAGFEWDNRKAADEHRLWQARNYIRRIKITYEGKDTKVFHVPAGRICVTEECEDLFQNREGSYKPAASIIKNVDEYQAAIGEIQGKIASLRRSLDHLLEVARQQPQSDDRSVVVAQIARALDLMEHALTRH